MDAFSSAGADFATEQQAAAEASAAADAKAIEEGVPPAVHEGQILRQTAARKDAALAELTRLQLRTQCVADAFLCASLLDRGAQLGLAVAAVEDEIAAVDSVEASEAKRKKPRDDAERAARLDAKAKREEDKERLANQVRHLKIRVAHVEDEHAQASEMAARSRGRLAALCAGLPLLGGSPMKQQEAQPAEAQGQPKEEPEAKKPVVDLAAMMAAANSSDEEEEEEEDEAADAAPQPPAAGSARRRRSVEPLEAAMNITGEGFTGIPPELEAGIMEQRKVTNRCTREAGTRAEELEAEAAETAKKLVSEREKGFEERIKRADEMALAEYEQALIIGDHAARMVTDAKRKSQLVQKGADSLSSAKSTLASTDSFQAISKNLQANAKLNALDFLSQGQSVMDEVLRQKKAAASGSPKARLQQKFQAIWEKVDTNGDGTLDAAEVRSVMQSMGKKFTDAEFEEAMAEMDKDGSGALDFEEAFAWWHAQDPGAQMQLEQSVKGMKLELDELADESDRVAQALDNAQSVGDGDMKERLERLRRDGMDTLDSGSIDTALQNSGFVSEIRSVVVTYIQSAVAGINLPVISGSKDWGAYEISGLAIDSIEILPENVQVDIAEGVEIRLLKIQSVFKEFQWSFSKDTFPRMKDGGTATAQMVDLSAEISFDIVTDAQKAITVDDVVPVISLAQLNVQVGGGSHAWLYNKLLKLFGERVKTVVQTEMQKSMTDGVALLKTKMTDVTRGFATGVVDGQDS